MAATAGAKPRRPETRGFPGKYGCLSLAASTDLNIRSLETGASGKEALGCGAASGCRVSKSSRGGCTGNAGTKRPGSQCSDREQPRARGRGRERKSSALIFYNSEEFRVSI